MLEAVLLVGGQGTRLRPLTLTTPKQMLPVAGVPFLTHQIVKLKQAGVERVVLATSYRAADFTEYFGDGSTWGVELVHVKEKEPLGTGGAIRNAVAGLVSDADAPVVILNGDVLSGHDLEAQIQSHLNRAADVTLHLVQVDDPRAFGAVPTDDDDRVLAFLEKMQQPPTDWVNAGAYVVRRGVIDDIPAGQVVSVERDTFPHLLSQGRDVRAWRESAYWLDVGTPAALVRASADLVRGIFVSAAVPPPADSLVLPGAKVAVDAYIHGGTVVGAHASVGSGADIDGSILMDKCVVAEGARVVRSVVGHGARIGSGSVLVDAVVGDRDVWNAEPGHT